MKKIENYKLEELRLCLELSSIFFRISHNKNHLVEIMNKNILEGAVEVTRLEDQPLRFAETSRFGPLIEKAIFFSEGVFGFEDLKEWFLVDPKDSTDILWLQSVDNASTAFPLYPSELLGGQEGCYYILTIPGDITRMTANTSAPVMIDGLTGCQTLNAKGKVNLEVYRDIKKNVMAS